MKKIRVFALAVILCISALLISSCAKTVTVMEYKGEELSANLYSYWLSQIKSGYVSSATDTDSYWDTKYSNGQTYEQKMREIVDFNVKVTLVCQSLFDDMGLKITKSEQSDIDTALSDLVASYGSKSELNSALANYNINYKMLKKIYEMELKTSKVFDALYANNGARKIDDKTLDKYFVENYSHIDVIMIYDSYVYELDKDGKPIYDALTGTYKTKKLTDAESKQKNELADDILKRLDAGESFDDLKAKYNEDPQSENFKDGYYVSSNDLSSYGSEIVLASQEIKIGEHKKVDDGTVICIIKRKELVDKVYADEAYKDQFSNLIDYCEQADFNKYMEELTVDVKVNTEEVAKISVRDAALINY